MPLRRKGNIVEVPVTSSGQDDDLDEICYNNDEYGVEDGNNGPNAGGGNGNVTGSSSGSSTSRSASPSSKPDGFGKRHVIAFMGFWGFVASYAMRVNLSIAIVEMVTSNSSGNSNHSLDVCQSLLHVDDSMSPLAPHKISEGEFNWDGKDQGIILGSFFWGYVATQVPGGMLSERIGGKWPFGIGMLITAIFSLLTPWAARTSKAVLIVVRVIQGFGEGVTNPAMHALLAKWLPPLERSKLGAFVYAGAQIGTVIAMPLCGFLISSGWLGGWPSVFYVMGVAGIIWFIFWTVLVYDTPASHPYIEAKELSYIQHSIGAQSSKHKLPTPWRKMLTSMPVLAILVTQTGQGWGLYTLLTELPTYMKNVLHFDIKSNGWLSALPYFVMWIVSVIASYYADFLRENDVASTTTVRKLFNTIGHWIPAIALIGAGYSGCDRLLTVSLVTIAIGINGCMYAGYQVNHLDIAPNHAAVMMGITNGFANLCGIAAPYVAGVIISDGGTLNDWRLVFIISAVIFVVDNIFYIIFASGDEQPWNRDPTIPYIDDEQSYSDQDHAPLLSDSRSTKRRRKSKSPGHSRVHVHSSD